MHSTYEWEVHLHRPSADRTVLVNSLFLWLVWLRFIWLKPRSHSADEIGSTFSIEINFCKCGPTTSFFLNNAYSKYQAQVHVTGRLSYCQTGVGVHWGGWHWPPRGWFPCDNWGGRPNNWGVEPPQPLRQLSHCADSQTNSTDLGCYHIHPHSPFRLLSAKVGTFTVPRGITSWAAPKAVWCFEETLWWLWCGLKWDAAKLAWRREWWEIIGVLSVERCFRCRTRRTVRQSSNRWAPEIVWSAVYTYVQHLSARWRCKWHWVLASSRQINRYVASIVVSFKWLRLWCADEYPRQEAVTMPSVTTAVQASKQYLFVTYA